GATCADCKSKAATCDTATQPRVCSNAQSTCPAPYASCPNGVTTPVTPVRHVCSANDLQQAQAACNQADSAGCHAFFAFEQQVNPACASCPAPFDVSFNNATGILVCVAPFVDSACNHASGCFSDCENKSCAQCSDTSSRNQCENDVQNGQCNSFASGLDCV